MSGEDCETDELIPPTYLILPGVNHNCLLEISSCYFSRKSGRLSGLQPWPCHLPAGQARSKHQYLTEYPLYLNGDNHIYFKGSCEESVK